MYIKILARRIHCLHKKKIQGKRFKCFCFEKIHCNYSLQTCFLEFFFSINIIVFIYNCFLLKAFRGNVGQMCGLNRLKFL